MHMCVIILSLRSDFLFSLGVINPHDLPIYSGYHLPPLMRLHSLFPSPPRMNLLLPILACLKGEVFEVSWFPPFLLWFLVTAYKRYTLLGIAAFLLSPPTVNHTFSSVFYPLKPCSTVFKLSYLQCYRLPKITESWLFPLPHAHTFLMKRFIHPSTQQIFACLTHPRHHLRC